jgi:hypothetical protein
MVPLLVIDEAVERIKDGTIVGYRYDRKSAQLVKPMSCPPGMVPPWPHSYAGGRSAAFR